MIKLQYNERVEAVQALQLADRKLDERWCPMSKTTCQPNCIARQQGEIRDFSERVEGGTRTTYVAYPPFCSAYVFNGPGE